MNEREHVNRTSLEALGVAIRAEMDSRDVYRELAERAEDALIRRRFELLAAEEARHLDYLTEQYKETAGEVPLQLPPTDLPAGMASMKDRARRTLDDVLDMAIDGERRARELYLRAARETDDLSGRAMFRFLADMEYLHWMILAQEKDMLVRYPNYGRPGRSPWRAERSLGHDSGKRGD